MALRSVILAWRRASASQATTVSQVASESAAEEYPAVDQGLPAQSVESMLSANAELISRIKLCYGADRATFEADVLTAVRNVAGYVNILPATADNFFSQAGGLLRLSLEVAFYSLQGTDGYIISGQSTISTRRNLEPRWRYATFLAGLCSELHRTLNSAIVTDESGDSWSPYLGGLTTWLQGRRAKRFFVRWLAAPQEIRSLGLFALPHIVSPATMQHLASDNNVVVPQFLACVTGVPLYRDKNILFDLVRRATALVINRDLIASANRYGRPILGAHLERYLLDAMRRLVSSHPAWKPNQEKSRVWLGRDGLYLIWPNCVNEICKLLEDDELPGVPKAPETILEIMQSAGVFRARDGPNPLWTIAPPERLSDQSPGKTAFDAVRLASPEILLPSHPPVDALPFDLFLPKAGPQASPAHAAQPPDETAQAETLPLDLGSPPAPGSEQSAMDEQPPVEASDGDTANKPRRYKLDAPIRLNPLIRQALTVAVDSLNQDASAAVAIAAADGLFVPLDHFKGRAIDTQVLLRELAENEMTVATVANRAKTTERGFHGKQQIGIVLKPEFVEGFDPSHTAGAGAC